MSPRISVVVPFYNVEQYLEACLDSIAAQTRADLEVIMVDDGSSDGGAVIAKAFGARDPRFRLVQQDNQGLGPARNTGVRHATGDYLAFVDSDDLLPENAYELLAGSLEETGSAFASGGVVRLGPDGFSKAWIPPAVFATTRRETHVRHEPLLFWDRSAWNKVFRRDFWDEHGFAFPGGLYEDNPVTVAAHVLAEKMDVVGEIVYHYRVRDEPGGSITQRREEPDNALARLRSVAATARSVGEIAPELRPAFDLTVLKGDMVWVLRAIGHETELDGELFDTAGAYVAEVAPEVLDGLGPMHRLKCHLVGAGLREELRELMGFDATRRRHAGVVRRGVLRPRWYHDFPLLGDARVPERLFRADAELTPTVRVDEVAWRDGDLEISGHAYLQRFDLSSPTATKMELRLVNGDERLPLPAIRTERPDVTAESGQAAASYRWSGFVATVAADRLMTGTWRLEVTQRAKGLSRSAVAQGPSDARRRWPHGAEIGGLWVQPVCAGGFEIRVRKSKAVVTGCSVDGGTLTLTGRARGAKEGCELLVGTRLRVPVTTDGKGGFTAAVSTLDLPDEEEWPLSLSTAKGDLRLAGGALLPAATGRAVLARTRYGNLLLAVRPDGPRVVSVRRAEDGDLLLAGDLDGGLRLRHSISGELRPLPQDPDGTVRIGPAAGPLEGGAWDLVGADLLPAVADRGTLAAIPGPRIAGQAELDLLAIHGDSLQLRVRAGLGPDERGGFAQRELAEERYPELRRRPLRDTVVFESWEGKQCSDSPRAIFDALRSGRPDLDLVWVSRDGRFAAPEGARCVVRDGAAHYEELATARYLVSNSTLPAWFHKRDGQTYLQTWHGTPLKKIGFDMEQVKTAEGAAYLERFARDVACWDYLVSPNPFSTPILRRAFRFDGEVIESGYPRNDVLKAPDRAAAAARVRAELGLPEGKRIVLYAPTWRDDRHRQGRYRFDSPLDLDEMRAELGDDHLLLIRAHANIADTVPTVEGFAVDVTRHPDVADLYLVADVLVTDYSSVMFDFAVTGRPVLCYTYDLADYRDRLRGFYFDLEAEGPGPVLHETGQLIEELRLAAAAEGPSDRHRAFVERFCPLDDGGATARVVDRVFGEAR